MSLVVKSICRLLGRWYFGFLENNPNVKGLQVIHKINPRAGAQGRRGGEGES